MIDLRECLTVQASSHRGAWLQQSLNPLGSRVTESQAYTDIYTKDKLALAGGPSIDKCVFCFGGKEAGGVSEGKTAHLLACFLLRVMMPPVGVTRKEVGLLSVL